MNKLDNQIIWQIIPCVRSCFPGCIKTIDQASWARCLGSNYIIILCFVSIITPHVVFLINSMNETNTPAAAWQTNTRRPKIQTAGAWTSVWLSGPARNSHTDVRTHTLHTNTQLLVCHFLHLEILLYNIFVSWNFQVWSCLLNNSAYWFNAGFTESPPSLIWNYSNRMYLLRVDL